MCSISSKYNLFLLVVIADLLLYFYQINGLISNTGHSVIFTVENETRHHINITGGPLSYKYQFHEIHIHYGLHDQFGSEHAINGYTFPAEVSFLLYFFPGSVDQRRHLFISNSVAISDHVCLDKCTDRHYGFTAVDSDGLKSFTLYLSDQT